MPAPPPALAFLAHQERNPINGSVALTPLTNTLAVAPNVTHVAVKTAPLPVGTVYFAQITAVNGAGMTRVAQSLPITVDAPAMCVLSLGNCVCAGSAAGPAFYGSKRLTSRCQDLFFGCVRWAGMPRAPRLYSN